MLRWIVLIVAALAVILSGAGTVLALSHGPERAVHDYLVATYADHRAFKDVRVETLERGVNRAKVRLTARFAVDPDYGEYTDDTSWYEYANELELQRQGLRWVPRRGLVLPNGGTNGVFNTFWIATDPAREKNRAAPQLCPCTKYLESTEELRQELNLDSQ